MVEPSAEIMQSSYHEPTPSTNDLRELYPLFLTQLMGVHVGPPGPRMKKHKFEIFLIYFSKNYIYFLFLIILHVCIIFFKIIIKKKVKTN